MRKSRLFQVSLLFAIEVAQLNCRAGHAQDSQQAVPAPGQAIMQMDYVELQRTGCLGTCPAYTVRIYGGGAVVWYGEHLVEVEGNATARVDAVAAKALIEQFLEHGFWSYQRSDKVVVLDASNRSTTLSVGGRERTIFEYDDRGPEWLRTLDTGIDILADTHRWHHGDPAKEHFTGAGWGSVHRDNDRMRVDLYLPKPGVTDLMQSLARGTEARLEEIIRSGADVNAVDASGWTALMYAARVGTLANVRALLAAGAKADARSMAGETAMDAADSSFDYQDREEKVVVLKAALGGPSQ